jgi:hypothetical protein
MQQGNKSEAIQESREQQYNTEGTSKSPSLLPKKKKHIRLVILHEDWVRQKFPGKHFRQKVSEVRNWDRINRCQHRSGEEFDTLANK